MCGVPGRGLLTCCGFAGDRWKVLSSDILTVSMTENKICSLSFVKYVIITYDTSEKSATSHIHNGGVGI